MNDQHQHADLLIGVHIDREPYDSPDHTTGAALYALGSVAPHHDLFREVAGDAEDELIERNHRPVRLNQDEHFYSQKAFTIIVNAEAKEVARNRLSFEDVVKLAFEMPPSGPNILITVDYGMGPPANPQGSLQKGQSVRIKNGIVFDVTATDRS